MQPASPASPPSISSKPHYPLLDGLRGVAALLVVVYHIFESFATSHLDQVVNHGYLAVDFFFLLSGFVLGYAYDDRWSKMSTKTFFLRRLIRLQPMVLFGALFGALLFYTQGCSFWDVSAISLGTLLLATGLNMLMLPVLGSLEVRGLGELYPLNGPTWSLFFEYLGNILYALLLRRLPQRLLLALVILFGMGLAGIALFGEQGDLCLGWASTSENFLGGSLRLLFGMSAGLYLSRSKLRLQLPHPFLIGSLLFAVIVSLPRFGGEAHFWLNGLYESVCVLLLFPLILLANASQTEVSSQTKRVCHELGELSYPLYLVHYPVLYTYFAWVKNHDLTIFSSLPGALGLFFGSILLATLARKYYDQPLRRWLSSRFL